MKRFFTSAVREHRRALSIWASLAVVGLMAQASAPQARAQGGPLINRNILTKVPTVKPFLVPELRNYLLANKLKVNASVLDNSFVLRDGIPAFKLSDGSERLLMPTQGDETTTKAAGVVPEELQAATPYILQKLQLGKIALGNIKVSPNLTILNGVDRRDQMTPIKDQGSRGTCVAFATNAALEAFPSIDDDLSEQYSYHMYLQSDGKEFCYNKGTYLSTANNVLKNNGTVAESVMPYSYSIPSCNEALPATIGNALKSKAVKTTWIPNAGLEGASIKNTNYLESILNQGYNIVIATQVAWYGSHNNDVIDVVIDSSTNQPAESRGNHAMLIVGYNRSGQYFIVRNSWGKYFGHDGYAYISYDYLRTYTFEGFYIQTVSPANRLFNPQIGKIKVQPNAPINPNIIKIPR